MADMQPVRVVITYEDGRYSIALYNGGSLKTALIPAHVWRNYLLHLNEDSQWQYFLGLIDSSIYSKE